MRVLRELPPGTIPDHLIESLHFHLMSEIREYARARKQDVARGAETPELAALLVNKYGLGLAKALDIVGIDVPVLQEADKLAREIDPAFLDHQNERWAARPAGLSKGQPTP